MLSMSRVLQAPWGTRNRHQYWDARHEQLKVVDGVIKDGPPLYRKARLASEVEQGLTN